MPCRSWYKFTSSRIAIGAHILASGFLVATCPAKHSNKSMKEQKVITERKNVIREEWSISSTFVSSIIAPLRISSFPYLRPPICLCTLAWKVTDIMCSLHANPTGIFKNLIPSVRRGGEVINSRLNPCSTGWLFKVFPDLQEYRNSGGLSWIKTSKNTHFPR